jgi:hypothetical protein
MLPVWILALQASFMVFLRGFELKPEYDAQLGRCYPPLLIVDTDTSHFYAPAVYAELSYRQNH